MRTAGRFFGVAKQVLWWVDYLVFVLFQIYLAAKVDAISASELLSEGRPVGLVPM